MRNTSNLGYADNTTLTEESKEELSLFMKVKEREKKSWLKTQHPKKTRIMASGPII